MRVFRAILTSAIVLFFMFATISSGIVLCLKFSPQRNQLFSAVASKLLGETVTIQQAHIDCFVMQPTIVFDHIRIGDDSATHAQIRLQQLTVELNLWKSILLRHWITQQVMVDHLQLHIAQDANKNYYLSGLATTALPLTQHSAQFSQAIAWLSSQPTVRVLNTQITFCRLNLSCFTAQPVDALLKNHHEKHLISANLLVGKNRYQVIARLIGNSFLNKNATAKIYLKGDSISFNSWLKIIKISGVAHAELWEVIGKIKTRGAFLSQSDCRLTPFYGACVIHANRVFKINWMKEKNKVRANIQGELSKMIALAKHFSIPMMRNFSHISASGPVSVVV